MDNPDAAAGLLCPCCFAPVPAGAPICPECGQPAPASSTLDPMRAISQYGNLFRSGSKQPRALALFGIWLLFFPSFLVSAVSLLSPLQLPARIVPAILALLSLAILLRSTLNYLASRSGR